jgi:hypothetical protein
MAARQAHVLAVPAALITIWALWSASMRLSRYFTDAATRQVCSQLPAVGVLLLVGWTIPDHLTAAKITVEASTLSRTLTAQLTELAPRNLVLVNLPALIVERGLGSFAFSNGLNELSVFASPALTSLRLLNVPLPGAPPRGVSGSEPGSADALGALVGDPSQVVILFQAPGTLTQLTPEMLDALMRGTK